jgi:hypothetical protein
MSALDMSILCKDWTPTKKDRETVASMPLDKELTLSVSLRPDEEAGTPLGVFENDARVLILSADVDEVSLFGLRFWGGRLRLSAGTQATQESALILGATSFDFQVSFNPVHGGLAIVASWVTPSGGRTSHSFIANISNLKLPKARYYTLRLGAPKRFVDASLLGWRVNASYDLAPPFGVPTEMSHVQGLGWDWSRSTRMTGLVKVNPYDTLRTALQSIDFWRKAAEDALRSLEGGEK